MTRRNLLVIVTVLVSFFTFAPTSPVGACVLDANDRCEPMDPADQAAMFRAASAPVRPTAACIVDTQSACASQISDAPVGASIIGAEPLSLSLSPIALPTENVRPANMPPASVACAEVGPCDIP